MTFHFTCLECKNDIDLANYIDQLKKLADGTFGEEEDLIIECNHCATDHLVMEIGDDGKVKGEIIERDK